MKPNVLRGALIKSAIILVIFSLLVYLTSALPGGNVWNSMGMIIVGIFRIIQFSIGLIIGVSVCIAVLIGIFLGAVAIFDRSSASRMYEGLRMGLSGLAESILTSLVAEKKKQPEPPAIEEVKEVSTKLKSDLDAAVSSARKEVAAAREDLSERVKALSTRIAAMEELAEAMVAAEDVEKLATDVTAMGENVTSIEETVNGLQAELQKAMTQLAELTPAGVLGDLPDRLAALEKQEPAEPVDLGPLETRITSLQAEIVEIRQSVETLVPATLEAPAAEEKKKAAADTGGKAEKKVDKKKEESDEHRLFSYFDDPADKAKLAELVAGTLKKDMTYAQVIDFLVKEMGPESGKIITDHPSLAKDYIRQCRRSA